MPPKKRKNEDAYSGNKNTKKARHRIANMGEADYKVQQIKAKHAKSWSKAEQAEWLQTLNVETAANVQAELDDEEGWDMMDDEEIEQEAGTTEYDKYMESYSSCIRADMAKMLANDPNRLLLWTLYQDFVAWDIDQEEDDITPSDDDYKNWTIRKLQASGFNPTPDEVEIVTEYLRQEQPAQDEEERTKTQRVILEGALRTSAPYHAWFHDFQQALDLLYQKVRFVLLRPGTTHSLGHATSPGGVFNMQQVLGPNELILLRMLLKLGVHERVSPKGYFRKIIREKLYRRRNVVSVKQRCLLDQRVTSLRRLRYLQGHLGSGSNASCSSLQLRTMLYQMVLPLCKASGEEVNVRDIRSFFQELILGSEDQSVHPLYFEILPELYLDKAEG